jgi:hypothetical protein
MRASGTAQSLLCAVLCFLLVVAAACDIFGGNDDDDPPPSTTDSVTVSAEAVTDDGSRIDSAAVAFDGTEAGTGYAEKAYEKDADQSVSVSASEDDYVNTETSIDLGADQSVSLEMLEELPETVTVPFENVAADGDSLIAGTVTWKDSVVAEDVMSADVEIPASRNEGQLCFAENDLFAEGCKTLTPTSDISQAQEISVQRKTVTYTIDPNVPYGDPSAVAVSVSGSQVFEGSGSVDVPKLSASKNRLVSGNLETADQDNSSKVDRLYADTTVSSFENIDLTVSLEKLPACSDGIDNDGDSAIDKNDTRACTTLDGEYDPGDDNEILKGLTRGSLELLDDSIFVSKSAEERTAKIRSASNPFPPSVTAAKGEIRHEIEMQVADTISNQDHATHLKTGASNDNLTVEKTSDVVVDVDTANGFVWKRVHGIDRSFFADGPYYAVYGWHGSKARGESPSSGGKFYYYAELKNGRGHLWSYAYEPEDVPDDKTKSVNSTMSNQSATLKPGECVRVSQTDEICRVPAQSSAF